LDMDQCGLKINRVIMSSKEGRHFKGVTFEPRSESI
ncbi:unnamed protein product, partial [Tetraodon nigroviridis]